MNFCFSEAVGKFISPSHCTSQNHSYCFFFATGVLSFF